MVLPQVGCAIGCGETSLCLCYGSFVQIFIENGHHRMVLLSRPSLASRLASGHIGVDVLTHLVAHVVLYVDDLYHTKEKVHKYVLYSSLSCGF